MEKNYFDLVGEDILNENEMFSLKGGYVQTYGCESNVCLTNRAGAKDLCSTAYCRSGVGPIGKEPNPGICITKV